jgi:hypothetical protein
VTEKIATVFCASCRTTHAAVVTLEDGFPTTEWLEPHVSDVERRLVEDSGKLLVLGLGVGDWGLVEYAVEAALELNDPEDDLP